MIRNRRTVELKLGVDLEAEPCGLGRRRPPEIKTSLLWMSDPIRRVLKVGINIGRRSGLNL